MGLYRIARVYPDGADADYRIDGFDIEHVGYRTVDQLLGHMDAGDTFVVGHFPRQATVIAKTHFAPPYRRYVTTTPDGYLGNNLGTLAQRCA